MAINAARAKSLFPGRVGPVRSCGAFRLSGPRVRQRRRAPGPGRGTLAGQRRFAITTSRHRRGDRRLRLGSTGTGSHGLADAEHRLDPSPGSLTADYDTAAEPSVLIAGRYTLEQKIGEGGMGEVWVAKQYEPVKRKVALKLIKTGMDSRAVLHASSKSGRPWR